jgi:thioesterase domain-containing protein/acyl carrier protein
LSRLIKRRQSTQQLRAIITSLDTDRLPEDKCVFDALAKIWNLGLPVSWDHFYEQDHLSRVSLPTYPFERKRHWIDAPKPGSTNLSDDLTVRRPLEEWFYLPHWRPTVYPKTLNIENFSKDKRLWLIFANESTLCQSLLQTLNQNNQEVVQVTSGARYQKVSESAFIVSPRSREDYDSLIKQICNRNIYKVLHCWSLDIHEDNAAQSDQELLNFEIHQDQGFYSLMNISHALANFMPAGQSIDITVIADRLHDVYGTGHGSPSKATLIGPSLVIPQEVLQITIHCIDLALSNTNPSRIVTKVLSEIENSSSDPMVAYRGDQRLVPSYQRVQLNNPAGLPTALVDQGVYVITGGLGKVGLTFARYLGEKARARLCLVSRTIFPERSQWQDICAKGLPFRETIQTILNIEKSGAEIIVLSGDVANLSSLADCFSTCVTHFGKVNGVFHAAGAPSLVTPFVELTPEVINEHYSTKVFGTFGLKAIFDQQPVDFCCLISSSSAVLGGLGYAAYSAANIFLDHFVSLENSRQEATRWLSIDWDAWKFSDESTSFSKTQEFSMSPDESIEALERILKNLPSGRVIVATGDLEYRFKNWVIREDWRAQSTLEEIGELHVRPELDSTFIAATTPTEHKLGQIWQSLLGYSSIGVDDNFFELGGDSMLAIRLMSAIKEKFQRQLPLTTLLDKPTIKEIALALELPILGDKSSILVSIQAKGSQPPLFCAPGTGGSVIYLRALANELAVGDRPLIGLQAIVSPETQKPFTSIQDIARLNIEAMQTVQPSGPYYLCGHSFGSWVALEMAFQLQQAGHELGHLFIIDTGVPSEKDLSRIKNWDDAEWLSIIADTVGQTYNKPLGLIAEELKKLTWDEQVEQLFNRMKDNGLIDEQDGLRDVRSLVEMYKSQAQILYTPQNMKVKHLSLIRAQDMHESFLEGMPDDMKNDPLLGWAQFSVETPTLKYVSGNHLTMMQHPHVKLLASAINQTLTRSTEDLL